MTLGELIDELSKHDPDLVIEDGWDNPHSYRGYYTDLAFEPAINSRIGDMLEAAKSSLGKTFDGYKGGDFRMHEYTECWLACYGQTGETISKRYLDLLVHLALAKGTS